MGTKVQCKSYQHGFYSMKELSEANNNWSLYYEHEALSRQFCSVSKQSFINGYTEYEKEVLRRTILTHEATFRKQVHELHRLYSTQRKLMDELKRKEQCGYSLQEHAVPPGPFSSYMPQNGVAKEFSWSSSLPASCVNYGTRFVDNVDGIDALRNNKPSKCESRNTLHNNEPSMCESRKGSKILIDLQLPAEAYSDNEVTKNINKDGDDRSKGLLDLNDDPEPESAAKTRYASDEGSTCRKSRKIDLQLKNSTDCHSLVDLNEPMEEVSYDEAGVPSLSNHPRSRASHVKTWNQLSLKPDSTLLNHQDLLQNNGCDVSSLTFHVNEKEEIPRWQFSNDQFEDLHMGKSISSPHSFSSRRMPSSSDQLKRHNELSWSSLSSQNNVSSWLKDKRTIDNEHGKLCASSNSWISAPARGTFSIIPRFDNCSMASTSDSSCMKSVNKMSHIMEAVQTLPCFSNCAPSHEGSRNIHDKRKCSGGLRSQQSPENEASCKNGFPCNSQLDSRTPTNLDSPKVGFDISNISNGASFYHEKFEDDAIRKHSKGFNFMNVMSAKDVTSKPCTDGSQDRCASQQSYIDDSNCALSRGMSWLTSSRGCNESINLNVAMGCDPGVLLNSSQTMSNNVVPGGEEAANYPFKDALHSRNKMNEVSGILKKRRHAGFSFIDLNSNYTQTSPTMHFEENSANMIAIDINSAAATMDQHAQSVSVDNGLGSQPKLAVTSVSAKATSEIDLEAPIISHSDGNKFSGGTNHPFTTSEVLSSPTDIGREYELQVETARTAAEIILSMSTPMLRKNSDSNISQSSGLASEDTLYWFADMVTFNVEDPEIAGGVLKGQGDENGRAEHNDMDFFESMTLKLKEMKAEDFLSRPLVLEHQEEGPGVVSLLQPKFKRGQVRRRRQRRDFQKDILPSLATLSRHEVTEDLQTIGGLMKASGQSWQVGSGKRSAGRRGRGCRGRGGQQPGSMAVAETPAASPPLKSSNNELENDGSGIIGWGRTRRCRRQRCPSGNVAMHPPLT